MIEMGKITLKGDSPRWYPNSIDTFRNYLKAFIKETPDYPNAHRLASNIAYNLQYLQFLHQINQDLNLSNVLITQNYKSFIIHGVAIVEAIFYYLLISRNLATKIEWEQVRKLEDQTLSISSESYKIESYLYIKLKAPIEKEMTFDQMYKKIQTKKLLGHETQFYRDLNHLKKIRNRIHIYLKNNENEGTDWEKVTQKDYLLMKKILHDFLTSPLFSVDFPKTKMFDFLLEQE